MKKRDNDRRENKRGSESRAATGKNEREKELEGRMGDGAERRKDRGQRRREQCWAQRRTEFG